MGPDDEHAGAAGEIAAELLAARDQVVAVRDPPLQHRSLKAGGGLLGGPLGRAHALDLGGDQRGRRAAASTPSGVSSRLRIRSCPTVASATLSSIVLTSAASRISERSSAGERAATASTDAERSIRIRLASERARRRAQDLGQPGAGLDRVGDRRERAEVGRGGRRGLPARALSATSLNLVRPLGRPALENRGHSNTTSAPASTPTPTSAASTYNDRTTTATRSWGADTR